MDKRNSLLDSLKCILAIGVVFVHFPLGGILGKVLASIGQMGVIVFFIISGYAAYGEGENNSSRIIVRFKRAVRLTVVSVLAYLAFTAVEKLIWGGFSQWVSRFTDPLLYPEMIFVGIFDFIHADHLWFMVALVYGYLFLYVIEKHRLEKLVCFLLPFLLLLRICMETYTNSFGANWHLSGNAIVGAIPVMSLGYVIHIKKETLFRINGGPCALLTLVSYALMFVTINTRICGLDLSQIFKISTATLSFIFVCSRNGAVKENVLSKIGRAASLYIYIFHFLIGTALRDILSLTSLSDTFYSTVFPWLVVIVSVSAAYGIAMIKNSKIFLSRTR